MNGLMTVLGRNRFIYGVFFMLLPHFLRFSLIVMTYANKIVWKKYLCLRFNFEPSLVSRISSTLDTLDCVGLHIIYNQHIIKLMDSKLQKLICILSTFLRIILRVTMETMHYHIAQTNLF